MLIQFLNFIIKENMQVNGLKVALGNLSNNKIVNYECDSISLAVQNKLDNRRGVCTRT